MISEISLDAHGHAVRMTSSAVSSEGASVQESTSEPGRSPVPLIAGVAALALGAVLAAVIAARPARPPFQGLDRGWVFLPGRARARPWPSFCLHFVHAR